MNNKICCPNCKSKKVFSIDNEPLLHNDETLVHDPEIYITFNCRDCKKNFTIVFDLTPKK